MLHLTCINVSYGGFFVPDRVFAQLSTTRSHVIGRNCQARPAPIPVLLPFQKPKNMKLVKRTHRLIAVAMGVAVLVTVVLQILHDANRI
jgi:hypothetical protein